jgi:hypothetical protein
MISLGREPAGGSETWPRPGIAGHRPLAGDGASRRPKAVSNPRDQKNTKIIEPLEGATDAALRSADDSIQKGGIYPAPTVDVLWALGPSCCGYLATLVSQNTIPRRRPSPPSVETAIRSPSWSMLMPTRVR